MLPILSLGLLLPPFEVGHAITLAVRQKSQVNATQQLGSHDIFLVTPLHSILKTSSLHISFTRLPFTVVSLNIPFFSEATVRCEWGSAGRTKLVALEFAFATLKVNKHTHTASHAHTQSSPHPAPMHACNPHPHPTPRLTVVSLIEQNPNGCCWC